jgi:hypothetical protein
MPVALHRGARAAPASLLLLAACMSPPDAGSGAPFLGAEEAFPGRRGEARHGEVATVDGRRAVSYQMIDGVPVVEGDIVLPAEPDDRIGESRAAAVIGKRWPDATVIYEIDPALPDPARVEAAIAHYHEVTSIRLVERTDETDYVRFTPGPGCSSQVGRVGGKQDITLAPLCLQGQIVHEIGHALGLWHEHARRDRDEHIEIHRDNIAPGRESNFDKYTSGEELGAYDHASIMHYGSFAFAKDASKPTMTRRDGSLIDANRSTLSAADRAALARMYGGEVPPPPGTPDRVYRDHLSGDWNGNGIDDVALRHGGVVHMDIDFDAGADLQSDLDAGDGEYLVGDFDGDGRDDLAVRHGNRVEIDLDLDGEADLERTFGDGDDEYLVGDWDGDGRDDLAYRMDDAVVMDIDADGEADYQQKLGRGDAEDQYLVGDWNGDGLSDLAVRRGNQVHMETNGDATFDYVQTFGRAGDEQFLVGDWDADGEDNLAVRRGSLILMDFDFHGGHESEQPCRVRDVGGRRIDE